MPKLIDDVLTSIAVRDLRGSHRAGSRIRAIVARHPMMGQSTGRPGQRRMVVSPYPYAIFCRVQGAEVIIQRIRHTARRPT